MGMEGRPEVEQPQAEQELERVEDLGKIEEIAYAGKSNRDEAAELRVAAKEAMSDPEKKYELHDSGFLQRTNEEAAAEFERRAKHNDSKAERRERGVERNQDFEQKHEESLQRQEENIQKFNDGLGRFFHRALDVVLPIQDRLAAALGIDGKFGTNKKHCQEEDVK